jgi:hypothetical protein
MGDTLQNVWAGLYRATITDASQCSSTFGVLVAEPDSNITITHTYQSPTWGVGNGRIDLQIRGGVAPYTINWSPNAFGQTGANIINLDAGVYTAYLKDHVGCDTTYQIDITSGVSHVNQEVLELDLTPNPVFDLLQVHFRAPSANFRPAHFAMHTVTGARVRAGGYQNQRAFSVEVVDLQPGFYLFILFGQNGEVAVGRFVKE